MHDEPKRSAKSVIDAVRMTQEPLPLLVFSDLDGTLLDHETYSWQAAQPGLERLRALGAGLVLASSKTADEIRILQADMGVTQWPAIVENGAGVLWASDQDVAKNDYPRIRAILRTLPEGFWGFGDMRDEDVAATTGLDLAAAGRARLRRHSEPGLWQGDNKGLNDFVKAAADKGLYARKGGRFLTLSLGRTKADAMREITERLAPLQTIALGDAPNDIEMLIAADQGVIVKNPSAPAMPQIPENAQKRIMRTRSHGPAGWTEAILHLTGAMKRTEEEQHG